MLKLTSTGKFNTSLGLIFIIENPPFLSKGDKVLIDEKEYEIKELIFPTRPTDKDIVSIVVSTYT